MIIHYGPSEAAVPRRPGSGPRLPAPASLGARCDRKGLHRASTPARGHAGQRAVLDRRARRRTAVPAVPGLRVLHPSPHSGVPAVPQPGRASRGGVGPGRDPHLQRQPPALVPRAGCSLRRGHCRDRGAAGIAPDDQHRELPTGGGSDRVTRPGDLPAGRGHLAAPLRTGGDPMTPEIGERRAVISGAGQSQVGRRLGRSGLDLTLEAALEAIADAGLTTRDIDGVSTWPGHQDTTPGFSPVGAPEVKDALRLPVNWFSGGGEAPGQLGALFNAVAAVAAGFARHVLVFRTMTESTAQTQAERASIVGVGGRRVGNRFQWQVPFNAISAATWIGMYLQRHMHEYGTIKEQL